jgi:tetratricopeptide (TPR) repeat protein
MQAASHGQYHFIYPSYRVNHFVTRKGPLEEINQQFQKSRENAIATVVVLLGMGGCGKSQLALEYCQQAELNRVYSAIFWVDATSPTTIAQGFTAVARAIDKANLDVADDEGNLRFVLDTMSAWRKKWLLVFDNFDDPSSFRKKSIKEYFPRGSQGSILFTSRHAAAKSLGYPIEVSAMSNEEALDLLFRRSQADRTEANCLEGGRIIERLGLHALAIDQAGAYILARNLDLDLYLMHYNNRREKVLNEAPELWDYRRKLKNNPEIETKLTVFTTWELSFDLITGDPRIREDKQHLLTLVAFFDGKEISDQLFRPYSSGNSGWMTSCVKDGAWDEYEFQDILKELRDLSLFQSLHVGKFETSFSLHPLIQDWVKLRISSDARRAFTVEAILILSAFLEMQDINVMAFGTRQTTLSHLEAVLENDKVYLNQEDHLKKRDLLDASSEFAAFCKSQGRYEAAERMAQRALEGYEKALRVEHPDTLTSTDNLASVLRYQGKYEAAEEMNRRALEGREKTLGVEHPDTLISVSNLASVLQDQGKYKAAEEMNRRALEGKEKVLGVEHLSTLVSVNDLAVVLRNQGKYEAAEEMHRRVLEGYDKALGVEHPWTLTSAKNLALVLQDQGKYEMAEEMNRRALEGKEKVLGVEHPDTLISVSNLASMLQDQGKYKAAEEMNRRALEGKEKVLGVEHPSTLTSVHNLALLLRDQGKYEAAEEMHRRALKGREKVLRVEHPDTLTSVHCLADLLHAQRQYDDASLLYQRAAMGYQKMLGPHHPTTLKCFKHYSSMLDEINRRGAKRLRLT